MPSVRLKLNNKPTNLNIKLNNEEKNLEIKLGQTNSNPNAVTAQRLLVPRIISLDGDVSGSTKFDGSTDVVIPTEASIGRLTNIELEEIFK